MIDPYIDDCFDRLEEIVEEQGCSIGPIDHIDFTSGRADYAYIFSTSIPLKPESRSEKLNFISGEALFALFASNFYQKRFNLDKIPEQRVIPPPKNLESEFREYYGKLKGAGQVPLKDIVCNRYVWFVKNFEIIVKKLSSLPLLEGVESKPKQIGWVLERYAEILIKKSQVFSFFTGSHIIVSDEINYILTQLFYLILADKFKLHSDSLPDYVQYEKVFTQLSVKERRNYKHNKTINLRLKNGEIEKVGVAKEIAQSIGVYSWSTIFLEQEGLFTYTSTNQNGNRHQRNIAFSVNTGKDGRKVHQEVDRIHKQLDSENKEAFSQNDLDHLDKLESSFKKMLQDIKRLKTEVKKDLFKQKN